METEGKKAPEDLLCPELLDQLKDKDLILNGISDAIMLLDAKSYQILDANQAFLDLYKLSRGEFIGKTCFETTHHHSKPCSQVLRGTVCPLEKTVETGKTSRVEHVHADREGKRHYFELTAYPIRKATGEIDRIVHIAKEVTDRKLAEEAIRLSEEKTRLFAYSVAHDLKGPTIALHGLADRLCKSQALDLGEKERNYCSHILQASEQILSLLDSIQSFVSARELRLTPEKMNLSEVLQTIREEFSPELNARQIAWIEPDNDTEIYADKTSIIRVLQNLVGNALKYGGEELSQVRIGYAESKDSHIISVTDNGVGLGEESLTRIFRPFERGATGKKTGGSGLGLAIVEEIARHHGGGAWVESQQGKETTFFIKIAKELDISIADKD